jgi:AraC family transcriptional regulator
MFGGLKISTPIFVQKPKRHFVGLDRPMSHDEIASIPDQWVAFNKADPAIENSLGKGSYGIVHGFEGDTWRYACAYEVSKLGDIPAGYSHIEAPAAHFAVFKSAEHISQIGEVISAVMDWIDTSDYQSADGPMLEFYGPSYVPETGDGGFEIWSPVKPAD